MKKWLLKPLWILNFIKKAEYHKNSDIQDTLIFKVLIFFLGAGVVGILMLRLFIDSDIMQLKINKSARQTRGKRKKRLRGKKEKISCSVH